MGKAIYDALVIVALKAPASRRGPLMKLAAAARRILAPGLVSVP